MGLVFQWVSEKDKGQAHAINKGWRRAQGTYLAWLNSDDIYLPGAVSKAVAFLETHPAFGAVYGEGYHIEEDWRTRLSAIPPNHLTGGGLIETCFICQPTVFIRRSALAIRSESLMNIFTTAWIMSLWFRIAKRSK